MLIKEIPHARDEKLGDNYGCYISDLAEIRIKADQIPIERVNSVIHELLHAAFFAYGMRRIIEDQHKEEVIVNTFANAITQILADNPDLVDWIKNESV